jgi:uncharacterized protein (DUF1501 family)
MLTRRLFFRDSAIAMAGFGSAPLWLARAAAVSGGRKKILVAVFQRGAADGLNMVVPFTEKPYYALRPSLAVPEPGKSGGALDLDGRFAVHPEMRPFLDLYKDNRLAIIHAAGSPDPTRSHFDAQDYMESGTPGRKSTRDGWLNRALPRASGEVSPVRAVALGARLPRALRGSNSAVALNSLREFQVRDDRAGAMLESMYAGSRDRDLAAPGRDTFEAVKLVESIRKRGDAPANGAQYPNGRFSQSLRQIAQLIRADAGLEVAFADFGGWDHHTNEAQQLPGMLREFSASIAAFARDLGDRMEDVALVTMSEFGRTVKENGNRGTDHGHANVMFALGGKIRGDMHGRWPGLDPEQLYERRDLAVTTDFRDVLGELAARHLGLSDAGQVFPGHALAPVNLIRSL